jgi:virginiamycin B lyase
MTEASLLAASRRQRGAAMWRRVTVLGTTLLTLLMVLSFLGWPAEGRGRDPVGSITEFPLTGRIPKTATAGPDGAVWFTEDASTGETTDAVGRISPAGAVTEFSVPGSLPYGITTGPDGALWFTEVGAQASDAGIGRITTRGHLTEYPIPNSAPYGITTGPDGALWATDDASSRGLGYDTIDRLATDGTVSRFSLNQFGVGNPIITGPDGNLWFPAGGREGIDRMTPDGHITNFKLLSQTGCQGPIPGIVVGPDGNLWFTEPACGRIAKLTPAGVVLGQFQLSATSLPWNLTVGADAVLWITQPGANLIGRVTLSGEITEYPIPTPNSAPYGSIALGPDANLWFDEDGPHAIARVTEAPTPSIALTPASGPPGTTVMVSGSGFGALERVPLSFKSTSGNVSLGVATADIRGGFAATVTIPTNATVGDHQVRAFGRTSGLIAAATFKVT